MGAAQERLVLRFGALHTVYTNVPEKHWQARIAQALAKCNDLVCQNLGLENAWVEPLPLNP
jgi:hypothetical protein